MSDNAVEVLRGIKSSLLLHEMIEPNNESDKALSKAILALEFQNSLIKDLISFEKIADVENAVNTKSAINSYRIMLERR